MAKIGYFLSCEEWGPAELLEQARMADEAGFEALWISDHYHPWNDEQGQSPFVWSVIGGLSQATSLPVTTGVTCPTMRIHPAIMCTVPSALTLDLREHSEWLTRKKRHREHHLPKKLASPVQP